MKTYGGFVLITILLLAGLAVSPATGEILKVNNTSENLINDEIIHYFFWDLTGVKPVKRTIDFKKSDWEMFSKKLEDIKASCTSLDESFNAQLEVYKEYNLIKKDVTYESIQQKAKIKNQNRPLNTPLNKPLNKIRTRGENNSILNSMCRIEFKLDSCITFVLGLNTFINIIGFDIISLHSGVTSIDGIKTQGTIGEQNLPQGDYFGVIFGFLGYWSGTYEGIMEYSSLYVLGLAIMTLWLPSDV